MKVCIFTETFHPVIGGGETQARLLAEGLAERGVGVLVLTRRSDASLPAMERFGAITVHRIGRSGRGQMKKWGLVLSGLRALLQLRREYDLVFVSGFRILGIPAVLAARLLDKRVVLKADCEGEMSGEFFAPGLARFSPRLTAWPLRAFVRLRNALLRRADAFLAITSSVAHEFADARLDPALIHRIPNAVDTHRFCPADAERRHERRRRLGLPVEARIVVYTGRLVTYKGVPQLVRLWPRIVAAQPDALLLLVGTGGLDMHACEDELKATVRAQGLERSVVFTGSVQNVHEYLQAADLFAFPTENDAFPSSVIEAMTTALPVVVTPVGAIPEIVRNGENGVLVEPRDDAGLARAIERLLADPELAARLGRNAWQTVQDHYSAAGVTERYARLFAQLTGERSPGPAGKGPRQAT
jgi:glycosyltransferase involved in cell wall biosynthesis